MVNMIKNIDRDIVCIRYNILNLPDTVQFKNGHQIINKYDASGKKLSDEYYTLLYGVQVPIAVGKVLNIKNSYGPDEVDLIKKHYVDNFTYNWHIMNQSSVEYDLEKVYNTEGYVDNISLSNRYNYFVKTIWEQIGKCGVLQLRRMIKFILLIQYNALSIIQVDYHGLMVQEQQCKIKNIMVKNVLKSMDMICMITDLGILL